MKPPGFWQAAGVPPWPLLPIAALVERATARRLARPGWRAPVPVICCGNASVGGAGKTTVALDLGRRLQQRGVGVQFLTRGYRGRSRGVLRVDPARHDVDLVGDEPLLLANVAPTWVGADRAAAARDAVASGAEALIMDDGLQNPGLLKTAALLVIDGGAGFGNGYVVPAGPLRERPARAATRCRAAVMIGADRTGAARSVPLLPVLAATLVPGQDLSGARVFGFCGIARPSKFQETLHDAGAQLAGWAEFPDHHRFTVFEIQRVLAAASAAAARAITTAKDAVRLPLSCRDEIDVLPITLRWHDEAAVEALLTEVMA